LPGVTSYGRTREEALDAAMVLAKQVISDRIEHGEPVPGTVAG
jgi:predicted RNase H-like HicB family nuclease